MPDAQLDFRCQPLRAKADLPDSFRHWIELPSSKVNCVACSKISRRSAAALISSPVAFRSCSALVIVMFSGRLISRLALFPRPVSEICFAPAAVLTRWKTALALYAARPGQLPPF